jgi:hypothetical protein
LTIMSATERLTAAIGRRMRAIAIRSRRRAEPKGIAHAPGQMVPNPDLSDPGLNGIASAGIVEEPVRGRNVCPEAVKATQTYLPIGPSCC